MADQPAVTATMVSSVDGHVTEGGKVASLTGPPDQAMLHRLRAAHDGVLVGATTIRIEGYEGLLTPTEQALRTDLGKTAQPILCIVSGSALLERSLPVFRARNLDVVVLTRRESPTDQLPQGVKVIGGPSDASGALDLRSLLVELRARYGIARLLCEGGPTLIGSLLTSGTLDELIMVISPRISGGDGPRTIVADGPHARSMSLVAHTEVNGFVFLRYRLLREAAT